MNIIEFDQKILDLAIQELSLNPKTFTMNTPLVHTNNVDSLDFVHLIVHYEEEFDVVIEDELHPRIKSLADLSRILITEKGVQVG